MPEQQTTPSGVVFPIEDRDFLEVTGSDAARFLHNYCTADIHAMQPGDCRETFFPNEKGRILAHAWIERIENDFLVNGSVGTGLALQSHLAKYALLDDVTLVDITTDWSTFLLVDVPLGGALSHLASHQHARLSNTREAVGQAVRVTGQRSEIAAIRNRFVAAELLNADADHREFVRIEAGIPIVGQDVSDKNLVQEAARTEFAVSFTKGCYLGQEPIARLDAMGHTNRELRTLRFDDGPDVSIGDEVIFSDKVVGSLSSVATHDGRTIALAMLRKSACVAGTEVTINQTTATVLAPPSERS